MRLLLLLFSSALALAQIRPPNGDFETGSPGQVPPYWAFGTYLDSRYQAVLTNQGCIEGRQCALLTAPANPAANSYGNLYRTFPGQSYAMQQLRFKAALRVDAPGATAQIWLRVDRFGGGYSFFQNISITSTGWSYYSIDVPVQADSLTIYYGFLLVTPGRAWVDDVTIDHLGDLRSEPPDPPAPLSDAGLANIVALARLAGYVRYFHPSDQASQLDWDTFLVNGVRKVESAASPDDLAQRLQAMFDPIAPTARVFPSGAAPDLPPELHPDSTAALSVIRWFHYGLGIGTTNAGYQSKRVPAPVTDGALPANYIDPASPYEADLGAGVTARVPVTLYAGSQGTLPLRDSVASTDFWIRDASDRATRLAGVILAWNVYQHFYPYFDVEQVDMPGELQRALLSAAANTGASDFAITLRKLVAAMKDGHGNVSYNAPTPYMVPLVWTWAEGQLIVTRVKDDQRQAVQPGDRILAIDGVPAETVQARMEALEAGATPQLIRLKASTEIARCLDSHQMTLEIEPYAAQGASRTVQFSCRAADYDWSEPRPFKVSELEPGISYVDLNLLTAADLAAALPQLQAANGIVFDFRGYPRIWPPAFIQHLTQTTVASEQFFLPSPSLPDQTNMSYIPGGWTLPPLEPYFPGRRVFLIDASAISQAETDMDIVEAYHLADFVGEPTAGTTGDINPFNLPGGFQIVWTDLRVLKEDGSRFHGVGIRPNVPVSRTRQGIAEARDEILERGWAVVKSPPL